jgi:hypothetical protein
LFAEGKRKLAMHTYKRLLAAGKKRSSLEKSGRRTKLKG